mgnify:FL=1
MDWSESTTARPVLAEFLDAAEDSGDDAGARQVRHVLIPSELVVVSFGEAGAERAPQQADLINVSAGGCCLVLPGPCAVAAGSGGLLLRRGASGPEQRRFAVRWTQDLGDLQELGVQYVEL